MKKNFMDDTSISAEVPVPLGQILPSTHITVLPATLNIGQIPNPIDNVIGAAGSIAGGVGTAITNGAASVATAAASQALLSGKSVALDLLSNPAAALPGNFGNWVRSGRYDFPVGGSDIDFYHNRLCFDEPCKYDPENSGDYSMEWLRRAVPLREYPYPPIFHPMQLEISKPDREYSLIPYGEALQANGGLACTKHPVFTSGRGTLVDQLKSASMDVSLILSCHPDSNHRRLSRVIKNFI
jgi:hypothetical protein